MSLRYSDSILEVVNDEDEDWGKEINGVDNRQGKVELCCSYGQAMNDNDKVALEDVIEVDIIFVI